MSFRYICFCFIDLDFFFLKSLSLSSIFIYIFIFIYFSTSSSSLVVVYFLACAPRYVVSLAAPHTYHVSTRRCCKFYFVLLLLYRCLSANLKHISLCIYYLYSHCQRRWSFFSFAFISYIRMYVIYLAIHQLNCPRYFFLKLYVY